MRRRDTFAGNSFQQLAPNTSTSVTQFPLDYNGSPSRRDAPEQYPLKIPGSCFSTVVGSYGSIVSEPQQQDSRQLPRLELPSPAIGLDRTARKNKALQQGPPVYDSASPQLQQTPGRRRRLASSPAIFGNANPPSGRVYIGGGEGFSKTANFLKRVFTNSDLGSPGKSYETNISSEVTKKEDDFFDFLDSELDKIETFYREKEVEATERLQALRRQLHMMRDQRTAEMMNAERSDATNGGSSNQYGNYLNIFPKTKWTQALIGNYHFGKNSRALAEMQTPQNLAQTESMLAGDWRDFVRHPESANVSYRTAKKKLKLALQEYYRGLELLKAYAYLNRKAFRKINKKFDKAVGMRPTLRYMSEKVNRAYFVQSEVVEGHMVVVEDLYSRYFEKGNRKIAVTKLRGKQRSDDHSPSTFRIGLFLAAGTVSCIQGLILAIGLLNHEDSTVRVNTSYLLQVCLIIRYSVYHKG